MRTDKRAYILQAAKRLFYHLGIHNVTIGEIAKDCGISKKTIYTLFENKSDVVKKIFEAELLLFEMNLKDINANAENAVVELKDLFSFLGCTNIQSVVIHDLEKHYPDLYRRLLGLADQTIGPFIEANIRRGLNELLYRKTGHLNSLVGTFLRIMKLVVFDDESQPVIKAIDIGILGELLIDHLIAEQRTAKEITEAYPNH